MTWIETSSANFIARHEGRDALSAGAVLSQLEGARERMGAAFGVLPEDVTIVLHPSRGELVIATANPALPPPWSVARTIRAARWAWLVAGSAQWFAGQTEHARSAIARRLREGARPDFPPGLRDGALLGGTVIDLIAREAGERAVVELVSSLPRGGHREALLAVFDGRALVHTEGAWRAHLARIAAR